MKVLVFEDERLLQDELLALLQNAGYDAVAVQDFGSAAAEVKQHAPDLVLLDVNLGTHSGFAICSEIRQFSQVPVIFLTAQGAPLDELTGLGMGADDYVTKPYHPSVLLARIAALLKRAGGVQEATTLTHAGLLLDLRTYKISHEDKTEELSKNECKLLHYLLQHKGGIVPRMDIIDHLWDNDIFIDDNALSVNVTRLRAKLAQLGLPDYITTKRGVGYQI